MLSASLCKAGGKTGKPKWEVADIFRIYGDDYRQSHSLPLSHLKVMHAIETCRTAALGGHLERCDSCGFEKNAYNSCRNRHCPKCQALAKAEWLEKRKIELLPIEYFHLVFTLPHELNSITLCNKKVIFGLLFKVVAKTLEEFAADQKHGLRGKTGFTAILHTWDQKLLDHFHLHCVVAGGVLSYDSNRFIRARKNYLFHVKALSRVFRGKFIDFIKEAHTEGKLIFPSHIKHLRCKREFCRLLNQLWQKDWVVYAKAPFGGPEKVLDYLGRYTHRVAIANHRIIKVEDDFVTFRYRDRNDNDKLKIMKVAAEEFIRRFLLHVLPPAFMRIRHYGFLANPCKKRYLSASRKLLGLSPDIPEVPQRTMQDKMILLTGIDVTKCPLCRKGHMKFVVQLPKLLGKVIRNVHTLPEVLDTS